jgi:hypothetical protein
MPGDEMIKTCRGINWLLPVFLVFMLLFAGCKTTTTTATTTTPSATSLNLPQLEYRVLDNYPNVFWCDPDYYPIARVGQEQQNAIDQFGAIQSNQAEFSAILQKLSLQVKTDYTDAEKLLIYKEHKKLTYAVQMTTGDNGYRYELRTGTGQGEHIIGRISNSGGVTETSREASVNTCPICLVKGTLISTPAGEVPVEQLTKGMIVWTADEVGNRVAGELLEIASTPVPLFFRAVRIELSDGRIVTASPGHPTAEGKTMAAYLVGDNLDGAQVVKTELVTYESADTYDILPAGPTGWYWANGILLGSTLKKN